jgi:hypothetical protein
MPTPLKHKYRMDVDEIKVTSTLVLMKLEAHVLAIPSERY